MNLRSIPSVVFRGQEDTLMQRVQSMARNKRVILGICGPPGAGKSTLADWLAAALPADHTRVVSMDGFHLSNAALRARGLTQRKGAIETFDGDGYAALLTRIRDGHDSIVYAPGFDRAHEEPIAATVAVERDVPVIITEGNYLLADTPSWIRARDQMDEVWFVDVDPDLRRQRLVERHVQFGKTRTEAVAWVQSVDEGNADLIADSRQRADLVIHLVDDLDVPADVG